MQILWEIFVYVKKHFIPYQRQIYVRPVTAMLGYERNLKKNWNEIFFNSNWNKEYNWKSVKATNILMIVCSPDTFVTKNFLLFLHNLAAIICVNELVSAFRYFVKM